MRKGMIFVFVFLFVIIISSIVVILIYDTDKKEIISGENQEEIITLSFIKQTAEYDSSQKVLDLINSFEIIERDDVLLPAKIVYEAGEGTEYDLLRLANNILLNHQIQGVILVYEYGEKVGVVVNFRDVEKPMYYYFEDGVMKMAHHGWSFGELIAAEETRLGIKIDRYGTLFEGDVRGEENINVIDVEMWI